MISSAGGSAIALRVDHTVEREVEEVFERVVREGLAERMPRHGVSNSLGVIVEDAIVVAALILGGVLDACPALKAWLVPPVRLVRRGPRACR